MTLKILTCFDPQGTVIKNQTKALPHKTKLATLVEWLELGLKMTLTFDLGL